MIHLTGNKYPCCNGKTGFKQPTLERINIWQRARCPRCFIRWAFRVVPNERTAELLNVPVNRVEWEREDANRSTRA